MENNQQTERIMRYADMIRRRVGTAVRPYRADGYANMMTRYGTSKDTSEHYRFVPERNVPDEMLTMFYEGNGLFAKIIDTPAEEALKRGFKLNGISDQNIEDFYSEALDELDWEETAMTAIKWARLYGGSIAVLLVNDGRGLEEPLDWKNIQSIDDIRVYDRSVIQPDTASMFSYDPVDPFRTRGSRLGMPEFYQVYSRFGNFVVHDSRCLVFQNGILPEGTTDSNYQLWGVPEYIRISRAIRDAEIAHGSAPKLLDRSIQPVYKMKDLQQMLATEEGEDQVLRRMQVIDMARGMLNSLVIDKDGEEYDFKTFQFAGVSNVISASCNMLSAITNIPQTVLFGQAVGGLSTTDDTSMENYYNYVQRIQRRMLKSNLRYLLSIIFQAGLSTGEVDEVPKIKIEFNPLWSLSDVEQADLDQKKANTQNIKARTAQIYVDMQALDSSEVRKSLASSNEFDVEEVLDEDTEDDLFPPDLTSGTPDDEEEEGNSPDAAPAATKLPEDMSDAELAQSLNKDKVDSRLDGGPGSGNFGHKGRPGKVGGSGGGSVSGGEDNFKTGGCQKMTKEYFSEHAVGDTERFTQFVRRDVLGVFGKFKEDPDACDFANDFIEKNKDCQWNGGTLYRGTGMTDEEFDEIKVGAIIKPGKAEGQYEEAPSSWSSTEEVAARFSRSPRDDANHGVVFVEDTPGRKTAMSIAGVTDNDNLDQVIYSGKPSFKVKSIEENHPFTYPNGTTKKKTYVYVEEVRDNSDGGPGSGNFGHEGREGKVGGKSDSVVMKNEDISGSLDESSGEDEITFVTTGKGLQPDSSDAPDTSRSVGVLVVKDGHILCGIRGRTEHPGMVCGPGGHVKEGENFEQAAMRETEEEFGIKPKDLLQIGYGPVESETGAAPALFLCTDYEGTVGTDDNEMLFARFMEPSQVLGLIKTGVAFQPFADSVKLLLDVVGIECGKRGKNPHNRNDTLDNDPQKVIIKLPHLPTEDGGPGSGNHGHEGRKGRVGGSGSSLSSKDKAKISKRLVGQKTHDGIEIKSISAHAFDRIGGRKISVGRIDRMRTEGVISKGHTENTRCYDIPGSRMVLDVSSGNVVTIMWRTGGKR